MRNPIQFEETVIRPGRLRRCRKGLYEPGQLDRVTDCPFGSSLKAQVARLEQTYVQEDDVRIQRARSVLLLGDRLIKEDQIQFLCRASPLRALLNEVEELQSVAIPSTYPGTHFFGHWLRDDCSAHALAKEVAPVRTLPTPDWQDKAFYKSAFGLQEHMISAAWIKEAVFFPNLGFNACKARRIAAFSAKLDQKLGPRQSSDIVYIKRGPTAARRMVINEDALIDQLRKAGVKILTPEGDTEQLVRACRNARLIISVEGSQLAHAVYTLADHGALLALQPPDRFYNPHLDWCRTLDRHYGTVIGHVEEAGFRIDPAEVLRMIDRLTSEQERSSAMVRTCSAGSELTAA